MRFASALGALAILVLSSVASALTTFNVTTDRMPDESGVIRMALGQLLTIDIRLSGGTGVYGLAASVWGYDESTIDFAGGRAVSSINHAIVVPALGAFEGLRNRAVAGHPSPGQVSSGALGETALGANGNRVQFFGGGGVWATNSNDADPGLDGSAADAQFRLVFMFLVLSSNNPVINIGTGYAGDGEVLANGLIDQSVNVQLRLAETADSPEPGTAILLGAGLALLASVGRRE